MTRTKNDTTSPRVVRGGGWFNYDAASWVRAASRSTIVPAIRNSFIGFRTSLPVRQSR